MKRSLLRLFTTPPSWPGGPSDADLIDRFAAHRDESAFELLVRRHSTAVWTACRRVLRNDADADDAFQATFLALARYAGAVRAGDTFAGWLHRVAVNASLKLRAKRSKAAALSVDEIEGPAPSNDSTDTAAIIHEELARLSDAHRTTVVLVDLQGHSHADAAKVLGWPVGTVSGRLVRARAELKQRLERRGVTLSVGVLTAGVVSESTVRAAVSVAVGTTAVPVVVNSLSNEVLAMLASAKRKLMATVAAGLVGMATISTVGVMAFAQQPKVESSKPKGDDKPAEGWNDPNKHPTLFPELEPGKKFDLEDAVKKLPEIVIYESDPPEKRAAKKRLQAHLKQVQLITQRIKTGAYQGSMPLHQLCQASSNMVASAKLVWTEEITLQRYAEFRVLATKYLEGFVRQRVEGEVEQQIEFLPLIVAERYAAEIELLKLTKK